MRPTHATVTTVIKATRRPSTSPPSHSMDIRSCIAVPSGRPPCLIRWNTKTQKDLVVLLPDSVAIDRDAILKQADKLLRQGKLDGAISEYVRLIEDQPQDWNSINALGDLYVRAGKNDKAIEQFTRIADHQLSEGFFPKAAALFKKALKVKPEDEHILMALAEIGER